MEGGLEGVEMRKAVGDDLEDSCPEDVEDPHPSVSFPRFAQSQLRGPLEHT